VDRFIIERPQNSEGDSMVEVCGEKSSRRPGPKGGLAPEEEEIIPGPW